MSQMSTHHSQQVQPPGQTGLKAERIQLSAPVGETRLKAERIQLVLRDLPGWRLERGATRLERTFEPGDARQVSRLLQYVAELGYNAGSLPDLSVRGGRITLSLQTVDGGWIDQQSFEMAQAMEVQA